MRKSTEKILEGLIVNDSKLNSCYEEVKLAAQLLIDCYSDGKKLLVCGNGGSAADCEHIVGELMKAFLLKRKLQPSKQNEIHDMFPENAEYLINNLQRALPAISLVSQTALMTAFSNDMSANMVFAQQVLSYGSRGDVLLAISTSGSSENILYATQIAKVQGVKVIGLTGETGGKLAELCDITIKAPSNITYRIQEYHLPIYHMLCACVENEFFGGQE